MLETWDEKYSNSCWLHARTDIYLVDLNVLSGWEVSALKSLD